MTTEHSLGTNSPLPQKARPPTQPWVTHSAVGERGGPLSRGQVGGPNNGPSADPHSLGTNGLGALTLTRSGQGGGQKGLTNLLAFTLCALAAPSSNPSVCAGIETYRSSMASPPKDIIEQIFYFGKFQRAGRTRVNAQPLAMTIRASLSLKNRNTYEAGRRLAPTKSGITTPLWGTPLDLRER
jgi:hypothetical protein